jgi:hypothetical protein
MKTTPVGKFLSLVALASLGLISATSQASSWHDRDPWQGPEYNRPGYAPEYRHAFGPDWDRHSIDQRQRVLAERIERGVARGDLNRFEARDLRSDLARIEQIERHFERDGRLDRGEWAELDRLMDRLAGDLRQELRDDDHRGPRHAWR